MVIIQKMGLIKELFGHANHDKAIPHAQVIGKLDGHGKIKYPEDYQPLITRPDDPYNIGGNYLSDGHLGLEPGSGAYVMGRAETGYVVGIHTRGNLILLIPHEVVEAAGFDPDKYTFAQPSTHGVDNS